MGAIYKLLSEGYYFDRIYYAIFVDGLTRLCRRLTWEAYYFERLYYKVFIGVAGLTRRLLAVEKALDGLNYLVAGRLISLCSSALKYIKRGLIDRINYIVADLAVRVSRSLLGMIELNIIDKFNYVVADVAATAYRNVRIAQTGIISYNIIGVLIALLTLFMLIIVL